MPPNEEVAPKWAEAAKLIRTVKLFGNKCYGWSTLRSYASEVWTVCIDYKRFIIKHHMSHNKCVNRLLYARRLFWVAVICRRLYATEAGPLSGPAQTTTYHKYMPVCHIKQRTNNGPMVRALGYYLPGPVFESGRAQQNFETHFQLCLGATWRPPG